VTVIGFHAAAEQFPPDELVEQAVWAERAGFEAFSVSDHLHPWQENQGHAGHAWLVLAAAGQRTEGIALGTSVTCPIYRYHPVEIAHAFATLGVLCPGRVFLGVGTGEALNEHILGDRWPPTDLRLSMLTEAMDLIRELWTGQQVTHRGEHFTVENAQIYTRPDGEIPIIVSAFGPEALQVAAEHGDGWMTTGPDGDMLGDYRAAGGRGPACGALKVCWGEDEGSARKLAHELWPTSGVPGQLHQDLPTPAHFEQAATRVGVEEATASKPCGPDPERYVTAFQEFVDAGFDEVAVTQIGPDQDGFFRFYERELRDRLAEG
jgi:G6PDH family F420-dependent oxidoreductase